MIAVYRWLLRAVQISSSEAGLVNINTEVDTDNVRTLHTHKFFDVGTWNR